jgi:hypothetical protein
MGFATVSIGSIIGCSLAFLLGRGVMRSWVEKKVSSMKIFQAIDLVIEKKVISPSIQYNEIDLIGAFDGISIEIIAGHSFQFIELCIGINWRQIYSIFLCVLDWNGTR